jgi:hypothetical protein
MANFPVLNGIQTNDVSVQAVKAYDCAATGFGTCISLLSDA